jgi:hypothetical protein
VASQQWPDSWSKASICRARSSAGQPPCHQAMAECGRKGTGPGEILRRWQEANAGQRHPCQHPETRSAPRDPDRTGQGSRWANLPMGWERGKTPRRPGWSQQVGVSLKIRVVIHVLPQERGRSRNGFKWPDWLEEQAGLRYRAQYASYAMQHFCATPAADP